jgi:2-dehydropantoate 2-reductase
MNVLIIGAGAVGLALGASLQHAGQSVRYWLGEGAGHASTAAHLIETGGVTRSGLFGEVHIHAADVEIWRNTEDWRGARLDFILVCTKTTANPDVARLLGRCWYELEVEPRVVVCQNGWGGAERFAARLPREQIDNARIITGFKRTSACHVEVTVHADDIHLGHLFGPNSHALQDLANAITEGGLPCKAVAEIERDLWAKMLYNCLLNPLGALTRVPYGELARSEETRSLMESVAEEIFAVLDATQRRTHWSSASEYLDTFYGRLLPATADHESSMLQDLEAKRPTEIDALCGAITRLGGLAGVATPVNSALATLVHAAEAQDDPSDVSVR